MAGASTPYLTSAELLVERPGCKVNSANGFAYCDETLGYIKPPLVAANTPSTYDGHCIPAAYFGGQDDDGASTFDECWTASGTNIPDAADVTYNLDLNPDLWLDGQINGCVIDGNTPNGFAICDVDYEPEDSPIGSGTKTGNC